MDTGSSGVLRPVKKTDKPRRSWSAKEEAILIAALKELIGQGWRSDNGFKAGYLNKLEEAIKKEFPSTDLKGTPHINSKLSSWKKNYYSLVQILGRSGVGLKENHMIECQDDQWEQIIKIDGNARLMRYKCWPYYYDWKELFGKDRATGERAEDIVDAWENVRDEDNMTVGGSFPPYQMSLEDLGENSGAGDSVSAAQKMEKKSKQKWKRSKCTDESQGVCDALNEIGRKTDARLADLVKRIGYEFDVRQARKDVLVILRNIPEISRDERFDVIEIFGKEVDKMEIFMGLLEEERLPYVSRLLNKA